MVEYDNPDYESKKHYVFCRAIKNSNGPRKLYLHEVINEEEIKKQFPSTTPPTLNPGKRRGTALFKGIIAYNENIGNTNAIICLKNGEPDFSKLDVDDNVYYQFIGEKGATRLDAAEELTTRIDNLNVAREMEKAKKNAKVIKLATGWERGKDGKWRYEIDDSDIVLVLVPAKIVPL